MAIMTHPSPERNRPQARPFMTPEDWASVTSAEMISMLLVLDDCAIHGVSPDYRMFVKPDRAPLKCGHIAVICRAHLRHRYRSDYDGRASIWPAPELEGWR